MLNPVTSSISRVADDAAVAQSIRLTVLTFNGEWPFEPDNGSEVPRALFEPSDPVSMDVLALSVSEAIRNRCSSYAHLVGCVAVPSARDSRAVTVVVAYRATGSNTTSTLSVVLRRIR